MDGPRQADSGRPPSTLNLWQMPGSADNLAPESRIDRIALSVVVPCRDSEATIGDLLEALCRQTVRGEWEVVLVDDGSKDGTRRVVDSFRGRLPIALVSGTAGRSSPARARNRGVREARGEFILFCDSDDVVDNHWASSLQGALETHDFVCGRWDEQRLNSPTLIEAYGYCPKELVYWWGKTFLPHAPSGTLAIRRELHERVGGFDESFVRGGEDEDYCWRIQELTGEPLQLVPSAVIHYRYRSGLGPIFRQARELGAAEVYVYAKWSDHLQIPRHQWLAGLWAWLRMLTHVAHVRDRASFLSWVRLLGHLIGNIEASRQLHVLLLCANPQLARPIFSERFKQARSRINSTRQP
jgi:glycosyltransferase involved in cell wall biosynthesis